MKMEEVDWSRRAENCGVSTVEVHGPGVLSPSLYNDRCQLSLSTVEVPQIQFLAGVYGHSVWQQRQVHTVQTVLLRSVVSQFMAVFMARWRG